jgi:MFS superfamily sulfate permease-like transporter
VRLLQTKAVVLDLSQARVVDHTVMERIHELEHELERSPRKLVVVGLEGHEPVSAHPRAARHKRILA